MMQKKLKVVWICHFSSEEVRGYLRFKKHYSSNKDFGLWNVNAIKQFEQYHDVELYIIFPHLGIKSRYQQFCINGINYICFKSEDDTLFARLIRKVFSFQITEYRHNRKLISSFISSIKPDIVHIIGAENPYYSLSILDVPPSIPCIVSLQTLLSSPGFSKDYLANNESDFRVGVETEVLKRATYIATSIEPYREVIKNRIKKEALFLNIELILGVTIDKSYSPKEYDFVYYAVSIDKACDYAIEAFAIALSKHPGLTLNISGSYSDDYKRLIDIRINELGISDNVFFTGLLNSHNDVIMQIKKSRFALLPLKVDYISSTVREAMACGLPVITTITPGTPILNKNRECVLLSEKGDYKAMADNMLKLVNSESYAAELRENSYKTIIERYDNVALANKWKRAYCEIIESIHNGTPISSEIISE